jgi:hypothetical protein
MIAEKMIIRKKRTEDFINDGVIEKARHALEVVRKVVIPGRRR